MHLRINWLLTVFPLLLIVGMLVSPVTAQDSPIVLSLSLPAWRANTLAEEIIDEFESQNPGIRVNIVESGDEAYYPSAASMIEEHLQGVEKYVSSADILYINTFNLTVESTRAGYFLDLTPLTSTDPNFNADDFIPVIWQSFQWDGGIWAMPAAGSVYLLVYKPDAFDNAGLAYPNELWTMDDLTHAVRTLAKKKADGSVEIPGMVVFGNSSLLFRSLSSAGFYDSTLIPNPPLLNTPEIESLATQWAELEKEGVTGNNINYGTFDYNDVPLRIDQTYVLSNNIVSGGEAWDASLLPGGKAGLNVEGFAISGGTQYPEQAYALLKFLSSNVEVVNGFFSDTPARQSLIGVESENSLNFVRSLSVEDEALIRRAIDNAIPFSELRYGEYLTYALGKMFSDGIDARTALQEAEALANANLQTAADHRSSTVVYVATPVPMPIISQGEAALNFGLTSFVSPLPNREQWGRLIEEFVANDPQIGYIALNTMFGGSLGEMSEKYDCFYLPYNLIPGTNDLTPLLNLDPFMSADPAFDSTDVIGTTLAQLQKDNKTWGFPIVIQPQVLRYHIEKFAQSGAIAPQNGWTIDAFNDALHALKINPDDPEPFVSGDFGGTHLLLLIAAYGGIPLDYRTNPVTVDFASPANADAIRQVLDLAKQGYIKYQKLGNFVGGGGFFGDDIAIYNESLSGFSFRSEATENPYRLTSYPTGRQFSAVSYEIGGAYISATSQNPDACYRWISHLARHPELFSAMPARRSFIDDPAITASLGPDLISIYRQLATLMQNPTTIILPTPFGAGGGSVGNFVVQLWLYRAFDKYVLEEADLEAVLDEAQTYAAAYLGCIANIPPNTLPSNATQREQLAYFKQFTDCAVNVDSSLGSLFNFGD